MQAAGMSVDAAGDISAKGWDYKAANNYAVKRIQKGDYAKAIVVLEAIEKQYPGHFHTAANLGTAYELIGNNQLALQWIKQSVVRSPHDPQSAEWLHVAILQAKLALANQPDWLNSHYVTGVDFGNGAEPVKPRDPLQDFQGKARTLDELDRALSRVLKERMKLVNQRDPVMGDLLLTQADLASLTHTDDPEGGYRSALTYGANKQALINKRLQALEARQPAGHAFMTGVAGVSVVFGLTAWLYWRSRLRRSD